MQHHGTYDSICAENPQLQESWQKMMREEEEESDAESLDNVSINDERKELMRQVSIRSKEEKILKRSLSDIGKKIPAQNMMICNFESSSKLTSSHVYHSK